MRTTAQARSTTQRTCFETIAVNILSSDAVIYVVFCLRGHILFSYSAAIFNSGHIQFLRFQSSVIFVFVVVVVYYLFEQVMAQQSLCLAEKREIIRPCDYRMSAVAT